MRRIHIIAVNHSFLPDLTIALKKKGYEVTGSDEIISETNKEKFQAANIHYFSGWQPEKINQGIDFIVPATDVTPDNPELKRARELNLQVMSVPEFIYDRTKSKTRVVVTGSKGKRSLLALIINVLKKQNVLFDYALNEKVPGIDKVVDLSYNTRIAIIEGDDINASLVGNKHKLEFYRPHIALISNILWEKTSVFPEEKDYISILKNFAATIERDGKFIFNERDNILKKISETIREDITAMPYTEHSIIRKNNKIFLDTRFGEFPIKTTDPYFLENLNGARYVCRQLGVQDRDFYLAISELFQKI